MTQINNSELGLDVRNKLNATGLRKNNFGATADPATTDDSGEGYEVGSRWINVNTDVLFECLDATEDAAIWRAVATVSDLVALGDLLIRQDDYTWAQGDVLIAGAVDHEVTGLTPEAPGGGDLYAGGSDEPVTANEIHEAMLWGAALTDTSNVYDLTDSPNWFARITMPASGSQDLDGVAEKMLDAGALIAGTVTVLVEFPAGSTADLDILDVDLDITGSGTNFAGGANATTHLIYLQKLPDQRITLESKTIES